MTVIDFYPNVADPVTVAVRIVAKAYTQYRSVRVLTADAQQSAEIDRRLWTDLPDSFLPHCQLDSDLANETPVLIGHQLVHAGETGVLVNLQSNIPPFFSRFERLAEIIGDDPAAVQKGRERYAYYKERGYDLRVNKTGGAKR